METFMTSLFGSAVVVIPIGYFLIIIGMFCTFVNGKLSWARVFILLGIVVVYGGYLNASTKEYNCVVNWRGFEIKVDQSAGEVTIERKDLGAGGLEICAETNPVKYYFYNGDRVTISEKNWRKQQEIPRIYVVDYGYLEGVDSEANNRGELVFNENTCEIRQIKGKVCGELGKEILERQKKVDEQPAGGGEE